MGHFPSLKDRKSSRIFTPASFCVTALLRVRSIESAADGFTTSLHPQAKIPRLLNGDGTSLHSFCLYQTPAEGNHVTVSPHPDVPQQHGRCYHLAKEEMFGLNPINRAGTCLSVLKVLFESTCGSVEC